MEKIDSGQLKKNNDQKEIENDRQKKKPKIPFMQVDKGGDILSNFFSNFMRQFRNRDNKGLLQLLGSLWPTKSRPHVQPAQPSNIMGPVQDDAKLAKENRERWQEIKKNIPKSLTKDQSHTTSVKATHKSEKTQIGNTARKPGMRM